MTVMHRMAGKARPMNDFHRECDLRGIPQEHRAELKAAYQRQPPGTSVRSFFQHLLADWEYELLNDKDTPVEGLPGFLSMHRAGVTTEAMRMLDVNSSIPRITPVAWRPMETGFQDAIDLHVAGVAVAYAWKLKTAGVSDVDAIIKAWEKDIPAEYAVTMLG